MIEATLGALVAALVAKALDRTGESAVDQGEGALRRLVEFVRQRFSDPYEEQGSKALERVEDAPDSPSRIEKLARALDEQAEAEAEFGRQLRTLVDDVRGAGVDVGSITQVAYGDQNVQSAGNIRTEVNVSYGERGASAPRRISE